MNLVVKFISPLRIEIWAAPMTMDGLRDHHMDKVHAWVEQAELGKRLAFNQWKLNNEAAMSAFVLYWHGAKVNE